MAKKNVQVVRFIRKLQGGSQPVLVEGINGILYVLKFRNNVQGPQVLFNEAAGIQLYAACGLAVPVWEPLLLSKGFIERNRGCWMDGPNGPIRPESGLCLGTRFLTPIDQVSEILPGDCYAHVDNRSCFWMAWLIDVCCNQADDRQAVFVKRASESYSAVFIDFGHCFGGPHGTEHPNPMTCMYTDPGIYPHLTEAQLERYLKMCRKLNSSYLIERIKALPLEWQSTNAFKQVMRGINLLSDDTFVESMLMRVLRSHKGSPRELTSAESTLYCWRELLSSFSF